MNTKKLLAMLFTLSALYVAKAQDTGFRLEGIGSASVPVTINKMTNLIFPEAIQSGVKVSHDIIAQKVRGVENVLELTAARANFTPTNLSVYGRDGRLYSFIIRYVEDTNTLNYQITTLPTATHTPILLTSLPADAVKLRADAESLTARRPFLHVTARSPGIRLNLSGIWLRDSLQWLVFEIRNESILPVNISRWRFFLQDKKALRRTAVQEVAVDPICPTKPKSITGKANAAAAVGFAPFIVPPGKRLVVELTAEDGRTIKLYVKAKAFRKTRSDENAK